MQLGNKTNIECQLMTEEIDTGNGGGKLKKTIKLSKQVEPEFDQSLTHKDLKLTGTKMLKNGSCNRFKQSHCLPPMSKGRHTWRIKLTRADTNIMVGVAMKNTEKDTVDLYDKLPNIKSSFNHVGHNIWQGKRSEKSTYDQGEMSVGDILATTVDMDTQTITWFNETKNKTAEISFPDLGNGSEYYFTVLLY
jgi:hypothetical protein